MKIAIISDSHDNLANIKKTVNILKEEDVKIILHCGDVCSFSTIKEILSIFPGKLYLSFGNVDFDILEKDKAFLKKIPRLKTWQNYGKTRIAKKIIAFAHFPDKAQELAESGKYDLVFYGHTHKPWQEKVGKTELVNPGNLAGIYYRATFAIYDTKNNKLKLKILN